MAVLAGSLVAARSRAAADNWAAAVDNPGKHLRPHGPGCHPGGQDAQAANDETAVGKEKTNTIRRATTLSPQLTNL